MTKLSQSIVVLLLLFSSSVFAHNLDSLELELKKQKEDTNKVHILLKLSDIYYDIDAKQMRIYAESAKKLSANLNYNEGIFRSLDLVGVSHYIEGNYELALRNYKAAEALNSKDKLNLGQLYVDIANVYLRQENYAEAINLFLKSAEIYNEENDLSHHGIVLMNIGLVYKKLKQYEKALEYNFKALSIFIKTKDVFSEVNIRNNISSVYLKQNKIDAMLESSNIALKLSEENNFKHGISNSSSFLGLAYNRLKAFDEAERFYLKAIQIDEEMNNQYGLANSYGNIAAVYLEQQQYEKTITYIEKAKHIFEKNKMLNELKLSYLQLSEVHEAKADITSALDYYKRYSSLNDSLNDSVKSGQINELLIKYETEKKDKDIATLNAAVQYRNSLIIGSLLLLLIVVLLLNRHRILQKSKHKDELNQNMKDTTESIIKAQKQEQTRIAKELHDSVGTYLSTLKINIQLFEDRISADACERYKNVLSLLDKISFELRTIMKDLSNETLLDQGLESAYRELVSGISVLRIMKIDFHSTGLSHRLSEITEHNLFRIAQELLSNCIKHSKAENASLQLIEDEEGILIMYEDDGVGFDVNEAKLKHEKTGMGLKNIQNRVAFINGELQVESNPNSGSTYIIRLKKN